MINVQSMARKEIARERAIIYRKKKEQISFLEQEAMKWKQEKEKAESGIQTEKMRPLTEVSAIPQPKGQKDKGEGKNNQPQELISLQKISTLPKLKEKNEEESGEWRQYNPWKKEEEEKNERQVSTATIHYLAKKLIAKEWVKARGIRSRDPGLSFFEQQAAQWKTKRDEEERSKEEKERKIQKQKRLLERVVQVFRQELLKEKEETAPQLATQILEDSLREMGEVININWRGDTCEVWIEPWEEKKLRNFCRRGRPPIVTYKVKTQVKGGKVRSQISLIELSQPLGPVTNLKGEE